MQDRPDKARLLQAVSQFLAMDLRPAVEDEALRFRTLIAAHLCMVVAREMGAEDDQDQEQLERIAELLPVLEGETQLPPRQKQRAALFGRLDAILAKRAGEGGASPGTATWRHLRDTLREKLAVINPSFDTNERLPGEPTSAERD